MATNIVKGKYYRVVRKDGTRTDDKGDPLAVMLRDYSLLSIAGTADVLVPHPDGYRKDLYLDGKHGDRGRLSMNSRNSLREGLKQEEFGLPEIYSELEQFERYARNQFTKQASEQKVGQARSEVRIETLSDEVQALRSEIAELKALLLQVLAQ